MGSTGLAVGKFNPPHLGQVGVPWPPNLLRPIEHTGRTELGRIVAAPLAVGRGLGAGSAAGLSGHGAVVQADRNRLRDSTVADIVERARGDANPAVVILNDADDLPPAPGALLSI